VEPFLHAERAEVIPNLPGGHVVNGYQNDEVEGLRRELEVSANELVLRTMERDQARGESAARAEDLERRNMEHAMVCRERDDAIHAVEQASFLSIVFRQSRKQVYAAL
jgi:hypothetical protein